VSSGWIKLEKSIETDPRVLRLAKQLKRSCNADALPGVTLAVGALARLWMFADTHIREDDTIDISPEDLDEFIGIPGFCEAMPDDWLRVIDEDTIELPGFQAHNGAQAKKRALTQKRVAQHRDKKKRDSVTSCNAAALPDQDQDQDQDQNNNSPLANARGAPVAEDATPSLLNGHYAALEQQILAAYAEILPELPQSRDWNARRRRKLKQRIIERLRQRKPADSIEYWRALFERVRRSDFLMGRKTDWLCPGLEWLLEPKNFTKLIEGGFDNNREHRDGVR